MGDVSQEEMFRALEGMNLDNAPGPDGVKPRTLLQVETRYKLLEALFNCWLRDGVITPQVKECRSLLIPKTTDPDQLTQLTNWRPLTISSTIARTFTRLLANRLSNIGVISPRQRGFIQAPGCSENIATLTNIMREAKRNRKSLAVVMIDFAKAFDTVSHKHICTALRSKSILADSIKLIASTFVGASTSFDKKGVKKIWLQRGVKQGDPLSPLLFNLALDHLTSELERTGNPYVFRVKGSGDSDLRTRLEVCAENESRIKIYSRERQGESEGDWQSRVAGETRCADAHDTRQATKGQRDDEEYDDTGEQARQQWREKEWTCRIWLTCLAFADDQTRVSGCWQGMQLNLEIVKRFCDNTGLDLNVAKTKGFFLQHDRSGSATCNDCDNWTFGGEEIAMLAPEQHAKYLGAVISPASTFALGDLTPTINNWLDNIRDAQIRATTRAILIRNHVVPRLLHRLVHSDTPANRLLIIDRTIRMAVKRALHLPMHTPDGFLYTKTRDGGLGLTNLTLAVPRVRAAKDWALAHSSDKITHAISIGSSTGASLQSRFTKLALKVAASGDVSTTGWRSINRRKWYSQQVFGLGAAAFYDDPISNAWLHKLRLGRVRHTLAALQLRSNTYPTEAALARGRPEADGTCRRCRLELETLFHVLSVCPAIKRNRIQRHHHIGMIARLAEKAGWSCERD